MFLNGLKIKSILRKLEKANHKRVPVTAGNKLNTVCILEQATKPFNRTKLADLARLIQVREEAFVIMTYVKHKKKVAPEEETVFYPNDIGWNGVFKSAALKELKKTPFDLLISYYHSDSIALQAVSSLVPAHFKVGLGVDLYKVHDLSVAVREEQTAVFLEELRKYFKILKIN